MSYTCFDVEIDNHIAHVRMNRPDALNTMNRAFWYELPEILDGIDRDASARVVVLSSTGKHFSAGMDLSVFAGEGMGKPATQEMGRQREELRRMVLQLQDSFTAIERVRMPVLAAIQGGCIGGGVDLVSACDARYCTDNAFFCIAEVNEDKFGCFTPGTKIPIVSEAEARAMKPDYFLVLPWHFRDGVVEREAEFLANGGALIFPLPEIEVIVS